VLELLDAIVNVLGTYECDYLGSKICSFLQCKVDNDTIVDEEILALYFQSMFGKHCNNFVNVIHAFLAPAVVTLDVNVNTNKIEGRWAHIRRHDGNRGGKLLLGLFWRINLHVFRSDCCSLQRFSRY